MGAYPQGNSKKYMNKILQKTGRCDRCPPHGGLDNANHNRDGVKKSRPRPDKYKTMRKGGRKTIRKWE